MKTISILIDGMQIEAKPNQTILEAALDAGIYIPHLCSHPDLQPQGGCKLCVVEIDGDAAKPVTSCNTEVAEGMNILTKSPAINKLRSVSMELILAGHPNDCTSCRSYLNCELQALMQYMSATGVRMRTIHKKTININTNNPLIDREMERCIQCGRCVRVCKDIRGVGIIDYKKSEIESYIGTENDLSLIEADCRFCGACIEVCPTGALQDREGIFRKDIPREQAIIPCQAECPAHTDIPRYIRLVKEGKYSEAVAVIREKLPFPHALGYVCTRYCEKGCRRTDLNEEVAIRELKRFAVENDKSQIWKKNSLIKPGTGKKIAVIGAGPCGLTAAYYLAKAGHQVKIFERNPIAGGMMSTGIPAYRLPRVDLQKEIDTILDVGIDIDYNCDVENLNRLEGYDAILAANGAQKGKVIPIEGIENLTYLTALELLREVSLGRVDKSFYSGKTVTVLGGGNVAFDAARVSKRLGASVNLICLESRENMLADKEEIDQAEEEGVVIYSGKTSLAVEAYEESKYGIKIADVESFSFSDGKLELKTVPRSEVILATDIIVFAAGQKADILPSFGLELNSFGCPVCQKGSYLTDKEGVFAAGDLVYGTKAVIDAIASGRNVASEIDKYLGGSGSIDEVLLEKEIANPKIGKMDGFAKIKKSIPSILQAEDRLDNFALVDFGLAKEQSQQEADRCLQCDLRNQIQEVKLWHTYKYK